jgi:multidrug resistance efflux pump
MDKPVELVRSVCSRCGGTDPSCYICGDVSPSVTAVVDAARRWYGATDLEELQHAVNGLRAAVRQLGSSAEVTAERDRLRAAIDADRSYQLANLKALTGERDRLRAALRAVMTETGTSSLAHHYARDALDASGDKGAES